MHYGRIIVHTLHLHRARVETHATNTITLREVSRITETDMATLPGLITSEFDLIVPITNHIKVEVNTCFPLPEPVQQALLEVAEHAEVSTNFYPDRFKQ